MPLFPWPAHRYLRAVGANFGDKLLALAPANVRERVRSAFWRPGQQTEGCHRLVSSLVRVGKPFLLAACGDKECRWRCTGREGLFNGAKGNVRETGRLI